MIVVRVLLSSHSVLTVLLLFQWLYISPETVPYEYLPFGVGSLAKYLATHQPSVVAAM